MQENTSSIVRQRQDPLRARYQDVANEALITDCARTVSTCTESPFHGAVIAGGPSSATWRFGIHRAVGGYHDLPNPGDILCAALTSCLDSTLRMIADRLGIQLESLEIATTAEADVRGTLLVDRSVPVAFQRMECRVRLRPAGRDIGRAQMLIAAAEHSCVVLQTLQSGIIPRIHIET